MRQCINTLMHNQVINCLTMIVVSYPAPNPHSEKGLMTLEPFLGCWLYALLCNQSHSSPMLLRNAMYNQRTTFSLASAKPPADIALHNRCCATRCKVTWKSWSCNLIGFRKSKNAKLARTKKALKGHQTLFLLFGDGVWGQDYHDCCLWLQGIKFDI